jgi:hypothetical protein
MNLAAKITLFVVALSALTTNVAEAKGKHHAKKAEVSQEKESYCSIEDDGHTIFYVCEDHPWLPKETAADSDCAGKVSRGETRDGTWKMTWDVVCKDGWNHKGHIDGKGVGKADGSPLWSK